MTEEGSAAAPAPPGFLARLGLAIVHPRWAFAVAGDRRRAGGAGSDLLAVIALVLVATQLRWLVRAVWLGAEIDSGLGLSAVAAVLTGSLTVELAVLIIGAFVVFAAAGPRRELGRAFDLACVAALPLLLVDLGASVVGFALQLEPTPVLGWSLAGAAYGWTGVLLALAIAPARTATRRPIAVPAPVAVPARRVGALVLAVALLGTLLQGRWLGGHVDEVRPLTSGIPAPAFALPRIEEGGRLGAPVTLAQLAGKPVVLDFWATWCGPCLESLPHLDELARAHPEVTVVAVNIDDPAAARELFTARGYSPILVAGDDAVGRRYGVSRIPLTVVIDAAGQVRKVGNAAGMNLEQTLAAIAVAK